MAISQKCHYALRAIFELAKRHGSGPVKIAEVARVQSIPTRFLEVILNQLKQAGFVKSHRGVDGGYMLAFEPEKINLGDIIEFIDGKIGPGGDKSKANAESENAPESELIFMEVWSKVDKAVQEIYRGATFKNLLELEKQMAKKYVPAYSI